MLAGVPQAQDEDRRIRDLVAQFVCADDDPPDLAGRIGVQLLADARMHGQPTRRAGQLAHHPRRRVRRDGAQMIVQPREICGRPCRPSDPHAVGGGSGLSVSRLSAQA